MKIAYCSPFSPIKSGISDFSEELVPELSKLTDIDLFYDTPIKNKEFAKNFRFFDIGNLAKDKIADQYDLIVYQMGNYHKAHKCISDMFFKRPGILEIHDLSLHHFLAEDKYLNNKFDEYVDIVRYCHGEKAAQVAEDFLAGKLRAPWETHPSDMTVNKHYIDKASGVIVHSDYAKQLVKALRPSVPLVKIPLHADKPEAVSEEEKAAAKKKLSISEDCLVIGSFGFVSKAKRIYSVLEALAGITNKDFRYIIVGQVTDPDMNLMAKAAELGIEDKVILPGYVSLDEYKCYMQACDICVNLRYPTNGESSANLQRILGMGIPAIVTDIGTFAEYPDSCTIKVPYGNSEVRCIKDAVLTLASDKDTFLKYKKNAIDYITETADIGKNCQRYVKFFNDVINGTFEEEDPYDRILDKAIKDGIIDEAELIRLCTDILNK